MCLRMASKPTDYWQVLSARVSPELAKQVSKIAKAKSGGVTRVRASDVVRLAVAEYVAAHLNQTTRAVA